MTIRWWWVALAFLVGILLIPFCANDETPQFGQGTVTVYTTSRDSLPTNFARYVEGLRDNPPPTAPYKAVERTEARGATVEVVPVVGDAVEVLSLIRAGFAHFGPDVAEQAVRVAGCETGWTYNPAATNGVHAGLFQLSGTYHQDRAARLGFVWAQMWEAVPNITVAADLYAEQGWGPWSCKP